MIDFFMVGGTFNPGGDGVTRAFTDRLDRRRINVRYVAYPGTAQFGDSVPAGERALANAIDRSNAASQMVGGFSQGAIIAGNVAAKRPLAGCALIADPLRAEGTEPLNRGVGGYGILGSRRVLPTWLWQVAAAGDPISALVKGSPLRGLGDVAEFASQNPDVWVRGMLDKAQHNGFQPWWNPAYWRDWGTAAGWLNNYLTQGRHTAAYVDEGLCAQLATKVNQAAARRP
ncbi:hypothetical protein GCM10007304_17450 [Rhodococcoides trifolii]|uniref:Alpha/beta hydrolase n=1 Tax=Rhodococcoides trifolii TaxID=908250 RepID=A0A917FUJ1_9NOCA|nr:PE-PPE domain-containing protein [Rhodococcus trifolii]GGG03835.1 hypothetical protein GCM10007304_17450 [Rhodococcus trifolii]